MNPKKYLGIGCIVLGICVAMIPFVKEYAEDRRQQEILTQWKQEMGQIGSGEEAAAEQGTPETENDTAERTETGDGVAGILRIPAIGLEQPVLRGATRQNLNLSVATVEPTGQPGADGNFAIAGHNSRTYGRHFNRLAELKKGDEVFVDTGTESYTYRVTDIYVVEAEDVWVLDDTADRAEITLITCHYPEEGEPQRLIVKGMLQEI